MTLFHSIVASLRTRAFNAPLFPTQIFDVHLSEQIQSTDDEAFFDSSLPAQWRDCCRSGLLLLNDDLHASHEISQHIETPTGSYWHAIMHRREDDAFNSKYWWNRVGEHPAFDRVLDAVKETLRDEEDDSAQQFLRTLEQRGTWQAAAFVDACETARTSNGEREIAWMRRVQGIEMLTLLDWCVEQP